MKILLDPGHGHGAKYNRGSRIGNEGDNNFKMALLLENELKKLGVDVIKTRNKITDNPTLRARGLMGKGCELLFSIHTNAFDGTASGTEIWDDTNPKYSNKELALKICEAVSKTLDIPNRGVKYRRNKSGSNYYGVLRNGYAKSNMILEICFHDNYSEVKKYIESMEEVAKAIANVIAEHYKLENSTQYNKSPVDYFKQYETSNLKVLETHKNNIYLQQLGGKTLRQVGAYGINGVFFDTGNPADSKSTWSIAINNGRPIGENANTNHYKNIARATIINGDGRLTVERINTIEQIKRSVNWAIGGVGLYPSYDPKLEQIPADIMRYTYHTGVAFNGVIVYLIISKDMCVMSKFRQYILNEIKPQGAIAVDGGGSTQMLGYDDFGRHTQRRLNNIIGIKRSVKYG